VCAAPVAAGSGEGRLDYIVPGILGMLFGGLLFGLTYNSVYLQLNKVAGEARIASGSRVGARWTVCEGLAQRVFCGVLTPRIRRSKVAVTPWRRLLACHRLAYSRRSTRATALGLVALQAPEPSSLVLVAVGVVFGLLRRAR